MKWNFFERSVSKPLPPSLLPEDKLSPELLMADMKTGSEIHTKETLKKETEFSDSTVDFTFESPEIDSYTRIHFKIPEYEGRELRPGHRLLFKIPEEFRKRIIRDIILRHRKSSKYQVNIESDRWDPNGAYSRVELHNVKTDSWYQWVDPEGRKTDKFAESRGAGNPEEEVLHDWIATVGQISADAVRVTNVGVSKGFSVSNIHGVEVVFYPESQSMEFKEHIYTDGTKFIDLEKGELLPSYGAGEFNQGKYVGAIALNHREPALFELGKPGPEAIMENGKLIVNLEQNKELLNVEVAIGDTEYLGSKYPNTRLGWAKLWVGIKRAKSGNIEWFIKNANIPPQGVIAGGPHLENSKIEPYDKLVLESRADTSYLMGWRLTYK